MITLPGPNPATLRTQSPETSGGWEGEIAVWLPRDREGRLTGAIYELLQEASGLARRLGLQVVGLGDRGFSELERELCAQWGVVALRALGDALDPHPLVKDGVSPLDALLPGGPPRILLASDDTAGKVLVPLWAARHRVTLIPGATGLTADATHLIAARPALGDQLESIVSVEQDRPVAVTLLPGAVGGDLGTGARGTEGTGEPGRPTVGNLGDPVDVATGVLPRMEVAPVSPGLAEAPPGPSTAIFPPDPETVDLAVAERIVAFGRGAFGETGIGLVQRLADLLGATVAGSRPAADEGWLPFSRQVGLTGAIVQPRLYVAVGISGAPYHLVGVKEPETLIAINSDPEAPIFGCADLGLIGDLYEVLPELIAQLERGEQIAGGRL